MSTRTDGKIGALFGRVKEVCRGRGLLLLAGVLGLVLLVAIPLPGTGAWTGALVAAMLDIRLKRALPTIFLGVCIAAAIMTAVTFGVINIF